ncbi:MAG: hypothetical protein AAB654_05795 [Acidobacteriota bacterium]
MAVAGGAVDWNEGELAAYRTYCDGFPDAAAGARVWEQFKQEHEDFMRGMTNAAGVAILENLGIELSEGRDAAFQDWLRCQPDGEALYRDWCRERRRRAELEAGR